MRAPSFALLLSGIALSVLALTLPARAATDVQKPSGTWILNKSDNGSARESYCTVSRKFSGGVVFNYARNGDGELSLALDFQNKTLDKSASYTVTLNPGQGGARDFQARPLTPKVLLVKLGTDQKFEQALMGTEELSATIAGETVRLAVDEFGTQANALKDCVANFAKPDATKTAEKEDQKTDAPTKTLRMTDDAPLTPPAKTSLALAEPENPSADFEAQERAAILERENKQLQEKLAAAETSVKPVLAPEEPKVTTPDPKIAQLETEKANLQDQLDAQRNALEKLKAEQAAAQNIKTEKESAERAALSEKIAALEAEKTALKAAQEKAVTAENPLKPQVETLQKEITDLKAAAAERDQLKLDLAKAKEEAQNKAQIQTQTEADAKTDSIKADQTKIATLEKQIADLSRENKLLSEKADISAPDQALQQSEMNTLKSEVDRLKQANTRLEKELGEATVAARIPSASPMPPPLPIADSVDEAAIDALNEQIAALESENTALKDQIQNLPQNDKLKEIVSMEQPLREEIRNLRAQLDETRAQNRALTQNIDQTRAKVREDQMAVSSKNWNLEQATRRYQESEREVQRLTVQLEQNKVQCANERRELEYMMFDPQTAPAAQTAMLNALEDKIAAQEKQLAASSQGPAVAKAPIAPIETAPVAVEAAAPAVAALTPAAGPAAAEVVAQAPEKVAPQMPTPPVVMEQASVPPEPVGRLPNTSALTPQRTPQVASFVSPEFMQNFLLQAEVPLSGAVQKMTKSSAPNALRWDTGQTYGSMEQRQARDPGAFRSLVQAYLDRTKSRCKGDFAASPATAASGQGYSAYDLACMSGKQSSSAAVLFYLKDGLFNVIAHEAAPMQMNMAMDARDKIARKLQDN